VTNKIRGLGEKLESRRHVVKESYKKEAIDYTYFINKKHPTGATAAKRLVKLGSYTIPRHRTAEN